MAAVLPQGLLQSVSWRRTARVMATGLVLAAMSGCTDPEPFPYAIVSLAVMPVEVVPYHTQAGRIAGDHLTRMLLDETRFRVVGIDSTTRIFAQPDGQNLFLRFRNEARTTGYLSPDIARAVSTRTGCQGLLYSTLSTSLHTPVSGMLSLTVAAFEGNTGYKVWSGYRQRSFAGHPGEPAFNRSVGAIVAEIVAQMPRPAGEEER